MFFQTKQSTKAAIDSATAAQNTYTQQRFNDSITRRNDSINSIADSVNTRKRSELDSISRELQNKSLAAQIQSIEETQKEFRTENRPYVAIVNIHIDTTFTNNIILCTWDFVNLGKSPAKLLTVSSRLAIGVDTTSRRLIKAFVLTQKLNQYLAGSISLPWHSFAYFEKNTGRLVKALIGSGKMNVYFIGEYTYYSPSLQTTYSNKFFIEIKYSEFMKISYLINDEKEYKP